MEDSFSLLLMDNILPFASRLLPFNIENIISTKYDNISISDILIANEPALIQVFSFYSVVIENSFIPNTESILSTEEENITIDLIEKKIEWLVAIRSYDKYHAAISYTEFQRFANEFGIISK